VDLNVGELYTLTLLYGFCQGPTTYGIINYDAHATLEIDLPSKVVPLPPTVILLGSGLLGLVGWRRFRKG